MYSDLKVVNLVADPAGMTGTVAVLGPGAVGGSLAVRLSLAGVPRSVSAIRRPRDSSRSPVSWSSPVKDSDRPP